LLGRARFEYLDSIAEYNAAQFELYVALGQPPASALARTANPPPPAGMDGNGVRAGNGGLGDNGLPAGNGFPEGNGGEPSPPPPPPPGDLSARRGTPRPKMMMANAQPASQRR
jgi:hypothetical protein